MKRLIFLVLVAACTSHDDGTARPSATAMTATATVAQAVASAEPRLPAESNPPGDIPDSQAFVSYVSQKGYSVDVPEGWARTVSHDDVRFVDKFDGMAVIVAAAAAASHAPDVSQIAIDALKRGARAGGDFQVVHANLPGGPAVIVTFTSNSEADPVAAKRVRLENRAIVFSRGATTATVLLWSPLGADNVDQWKRIGSSFRWR